MQLRQEVTPKKVAVNYASEAGKSYSAGNQKKVAVNCASVQLRQEITSNKVTVNYATEARHPLPVVTPRKVAVTYANEAGKSDSAGSQNK